MRIIISNHAIYRINERGISSHDVKRIVKNKNIIKENEDGSIIKKGKTYNDKSLTVIVKCYNKYTIVITAYYDN